MVPSSARKCRVRCDWSWKPAAAATSAIGSRRGAAAERGRGGGRRDSGAAVGRTRAGRPAPGARDGHRARGRALEGGASSSRRSRTSRARPGSAVRRRGARRQVRVIRSATSASRDSASRAPVESRQPCSAETARARAGSAGGAPGARHRSAARAASARRRTAPACRSRRGLAARPSWETYGGSTVTRPVTACCRCGPACSRPRRSRPAGPSTGRARAPGSSCSVKCACSTSEPRHGRSPGVDALHVRNVQDGTAGARPEVRRWGGAVRHQDRGPGPRRPRDLAATQRDGVPGQRDRRGVPPADR